jgi:hypothetical protein
MNLAANSPEQRCRGSNGRCKYFRHVSQPVSWRVWTAQTAFTQTFDPKGEVRRVWGTQTAPCVHIIECADTASLRAWCRSHTGSRWRDVKTANNYVHATLYKAKSGVLKQAFVGIATATRHRVVYGVGRREGKRKVCDGLTSQVTVFPRSGRSQFSAIRRVAGSIGDGRSTSIHHTSILFSLSDLQAEKGFRLCGG